MSYKKPKVLRKHIKDCKRILLLMYRKGLLNGWFGKKMYWENNRNYIEPYYWVEEYYGEGEEVELIPEAFHSHVWKTVGCYNEEAFYRMVEKINTQKEVIKYLKQLPTKRRDGLINKYLKVKIY